MQVGFAVRALTPLKLVADIEQPQPNGVTVYVLTHDKDSDIWYVNTRSGATDGGDKKLTVQHRIHMAEYSQEQLDTSMQQ
jgi:hypothetical protein